MIVMPGNSTGERMRALDAEYPGQLGQIFSTRPDGGDGWFTPWLPYALDNGAYAAHKNESRWQQKDYLGLCEKAANHERKSGKAPRWLVVPDVVTKKKETLEKWAGWAPDLRRWYGWPLAFAVQDGMTYEHVPKGADVVFVGGSVEWKWRWVAHFAARFPRIHVGKVNGYGWLWRCVELGVESCDGTGWFMGNQVQFAGLLQFLAEWKQGHRSRPHGPLFDDGEVA